VDLMHVCIKALIELLYLDGAIKVDQSKVRPESFATNEISEQDRIYLKESVVALISAN
jgi:hypothetical protein